MLNKIKIIGEVLPIEIKESDKGDKEEREKIESIFYFSLSVTNPNALKTIIRCLAQGEKAKEIEGSIKAGEILEIKGYLRNEKIGRQVVVKVIDFNKLDITANEIDNTQTNQVQLLGKIIMDFRIGDDMLSFRIAVPREGNKSPLYFCRAQGELVNEMKNKLKKGDIILLEGFLQTMKIAESQPVMRISAIICRAFTFVANDSANNFTPLGELTRIEGEIRKINFDKPKENFRDERIKE